MGTPQEKPLGVIEQLGANYELLFAKYEQLERKFELYMENQPDRIKGVEAACEFLKVSSNTLMRLRREGLIKSDNEGTVVVFSRKNLIEYKMRHSKNTLRIAS